MTYALVAIVKDEAENIDKFLSSALPYCDSSVIVDTGSTDDTVARIAEYGIVALHRPFDNFGASRSFAFAQARNKADWLLALDADMTVEIDPDFVPDSEVDAYLVRMGSASFTYWLPLVLRGDIPWRSVGAMHEYTTCDRDYHAERTDKVRVTYQDRSSPEKTRWQLALLRRELKADPHNARTLFYIAQCHRELGQAQKARAAYMECAKYSPFPEEVFYSRYMEASLDPDWQTRVAGLLAAWESRPFRLEPLCAALRDINSHDLHHTAYALCKAAEPYFPKSTDGLFVHDWVWDWGITFERHIAAWWVGRKDESAILGRALLENTNLPPETRAAVLANLECE